MLTVSILDIMISAVVLVGLWQGFRAGAMKTALALMSWLIALVAASRLAHTALPYVVSFSDNETLQLAMAFLLVFLLILVLLHTLVFLFSKALKGLGLDFLDKIAGGVLGACLGVLKVLMVLSVLSPILVRLPVWDNSPLAQALLPFAPMAKQLLMDNVGDVWQLVNR